MDPNSNDFQFGKLTSEVQTLSSAVLVLTSEMKTLRRELNNINLFRAKVLGMSIGASAVVSAVAFLIEHAVASWAR